MPQTAGVLYPNATRRCELQRIFYEFQQRFVKRKFSFTPVGSPRLNPKPDRNRTATIGDCKMYHDQAIPRCHTRLTPFLGADIMVLMKEATRTCKERLRKRVLAVRLGLARSQAEASWQAILEKVLGLEAYREAKLVHTYVSSKENEVDTHALIRACFAHGKRVAVPVVMPGTKTLGHALIDGLDQLVVGPSGLAQPDPAAATWLPAAAHFDLVVVPGLAFDRRGQRIGWGGGYYDRFLAQVQAVKIGLCYDALVLDCIPGEPHDVPVDLVVAETAIYQGDLA